MARKRTTAKRAPATSAGRAMRVSEITVTKAGGQRVKNATLERIPGKARQFFVKDSRGRYVKNKLTGQPLIASRRDQQKATTATRTGKPLQSLERTARQRKISRTTRELPHLKKSGMLRDLSERWQMRERIEGKGKRALTKIQRDPEFLKAIADLDSRSERVRRRALERLGMRRKGEPFRAGQSPRGESQTALMALLAQLDATGR